MESEILCGSSDRQHWDEVVERLPPPARDIYFSSAYVGLHSVEGNTRAFLFVYRRGDRMWLYPFLLQPITTTDGWTGLFDIDAPYGYGGPVSTTDDVGFLADAHRAFSDWCDDREVVAEFVRLHPLLQNQRWLDPRTTTLADRLTVSLDLSCLKAGDLPYSAATCYMLRRADRLGCTVGVRSVKDGFEPFVKLYLAAMERLGAEDYYLFNQTYFLGLQDLAQNTGWLVVAETAGEWVAAALFLRGPRWLHYHLAATHPDHRLPGMANLLIHSAAQLGADHGLELLHLGGGRSTAPEDSLLKFKATMATCNHTFHIGKRIYRPALHQELCSEWRSRHPDLVPLYGNRVLCYHYTPRSHAAPPKV